MREDSNEYRGLLQESGRALTYTHVAAINFESPNLVIDPSFVYQIVGDVQTWGAASSVLDYGTFEGRECMKIIADGTANSSINRESASEINYIPAETNESFTVSFECFLSPDFNGDFALYFAQFDNSYTNLSSWPNLTESYTAHENGSWITIEGTLTSTASTVAYIQVFPSVRATASTGYVLFKNIRVWRNESRRETTDADWIYLTDGNALTPTDANPLAVIDGVLKSVSGSSQSINPAIAQHTIGSITLQLVDLDNSISNMLHSKSQDGCGIRHRTVKIYRGIDGQTDFDNYSLRHTYIVDDLKIKDGLITITCSDINRTAKDKIFSLDEGVLTSDITASSTTIPITIPSASGAFQTFVHDSAYSDAPGEAVGYIKIDDEIIRHSGWNSGHTALTVEQRGALSTTAAAHTNPTGTSSTDQNKKVTEYVYLESFVPKMIHAILCGVSPGGLNLISSPLNLSNLSALTGSVIRENHDISSPLGYGIAYEVEDDSATNWGAAHESFNYSYSAGEVFTASAIVKVDSTQTGIRLGLRIFFIGSAAAEYLHIVIENDTGNYYQSGATSNAVLDSYNHARLADDWVYIRISGHYNGSDCTGLRWLLYPGYISGSTVGKITFMLPYLGAGETEGFIPLPARWHLGIDLEKFVNYSEFCAVGNDLWNPTTGTGRKCRFMGEKEQTGKSFIEKQLLMWAGCDMPIRSDGKFGLVPLKSVLPYTAYSAHIQAEDVISYSEIQHAQKEVINKLAVRWNWLDNYQRFTKVNALIDSVSLAKYRDTEQKIIDLRGAFTGPNTAQDLNNFFLKYRDRYAGPPMRLMVDVVPFWDNLEVTDTIRLTLPAAIDINARASVDRVYEIQRVTDNPIAGKITLDLFGGTEGASHNAYTASYVLDNAFYSSSGTDISTVLTVLPGGTIATGNSAGSPLSGVYYYTGGDLVIDSSCTIYISDTFELRVMGFLTVNGTFDGIGSGGTGGAITSGSVWGGNGELRGVGQSLAATVGGVTYDSGALRSFGWGVFSSEFVLTSIGLINPDGLEIQGIPDDLAGSGGGAGNAATTGNWLTPTFLGNGSAGGNGGAGCVIVCRGIAFGASGAVDLSGDDGAASAYYTTAGRYLGAGPGMGGSAGACLVLIDGDSATPGRDHFTLTAGTQTALSPAPDKYPGTFLSGTVYLNSGEYGAAPYRDVLGGDQRQGNLLITYVPPADNGFVWYPADEEEQTPGYEAQPPGWSEIVDDDGNRPEDNANLTTATSQLTDDAGLGSTADWSTVADDDGNRPADGADVTASNETHRATAYFFIVSASTPATPTAGLGSFNFATGAITAPSGWTTGTPAGTGTLWRTSTEFTLTGPAGTDDGSNTYTAPVNIGENQPTQGATWGTNVTLQPTDPEIYNSYLVQSSSTTYTVGSGADYTDLATALEDVSGRMVEYTAGGNRVTLELQTSYVQTDSLVFDSIDLSWITITSVDSSVSLNLSTFTNNVTLLNGSSFFGFIVIKGGAKSPLFDVTWNLSAETATSLDGYDSVYMVQGAGSALKLASGAGVVGMSGVSYGSRASGIRVLEGGLVTGASVNLSYCGTWNLSVEFGAVAYITGLTITQTGGSYGVYCAGGTAIIASLSIDDTGSAAYLSKGVYSGNCGRVDCYAASITMAGTGTARNAVHAALMGLINCDSATLSSDGDELMISDGGLINADGATGTPAYTVNTLQGAGIIFQ